ncbi:unnamed protein product [Prunus armeniaca]
MTQIDMMLKVLCANYVVVVEVVKDMEVKIVVKEKGVVGMAVVEVEVVLVVEVEEDEEVVVPATVVVEVV